MKKYRTYFSLNGIFRSPTNIFILKLSKKLSKKNQICLNKVKSCYTMYNIRIFLSNKLMRYFTFQQNILDHED